MTATKRANFVESLPILDAQSQRSLRTNVIK